jgi:Flp pilus assembly protein TadD
MKNVVLILIISFALFGCSSDPKKEKSSLITDSASSSEVVAITEQPVDKKVRSNAREQVRGQDMSSADFYATLNGAIQAQNDEKIYQSAAQILTSSPSDLKALNALAMYHYKRGRFELSRYLLGKAISANPKAGELYSNQGVVQLAQGEKREATKSFRKAMELNPNDAVAASNLGAIYVQERDFGKAQIVLETAFKKGVRDARVLNNYAITLVSQGKHERAQDIYRGILKENENNKEYLFNYAILLVESLGNYREGLEVINRLKFVGGPPETRNRIIALENKAKAGLK